MIISQIYRWILTESPMKTVFFFPSLRRTVCHRGTAIEAETCKNRQFNLKFNFVLFRLLKCCFYNHLGKQSVILVSCMSPVKPVGGAGIGHPAQLRDCKRVQNCPKTSETEKVPDTVKRCLRFSNHTCMTFKAQKYLQICKDAMFKGMQQNYYEVKLYLKCKCTEHKAEHQASVRNVAYQHPQWDQIGRSHFIISADRSWK